MEPPLSLKTFTRVAALIALVIFLLTAFRAGWARQETDFPNYYTAAVLVREGKPLRDFYDWTWFERQMNYAGIERQLGAYTPQTPLTMLPMLTLTSFPVQTAKRVWLLCNLVFLAATMWLLSRVTRFSCEQIWLLTFCGFATLNSNFLYGQYYVFLLFLLTASFYFLNRSSQYFSGAVAGLALGLKLYGGPLFAFFLLKRKWQAAVAMLLATLLLGLLAVRLLGLADLVYYVTQVLPRSLDGSSIDPYNAGVPTVSNMLRHFFVRDADLNALPLANAPWLFFFLRSLLTLALTVLLCLAPAMKPSSDRRDFAWFIVAALLLSTSTASYSFILLLLPTVLLLEESHGWESVFFVASYVLLTLPLHFASLFPKIWVLLLVFVAIRRGYWPTLRTRRAAAVAALMVVVALIQGKIQMAAYANMPSQKFEKVAAKRGQLFASFPAMSPAGLFYQSMGKDRYDLRWLHDGRIDDLFFQGNAFCPYVSRHSGHIVFELVAHRTSVMMEFDPATGSAVQSSEPLQANHPDSMTSPDGRWLAYISGAGGGMQVWLRNVSTGELRQITKGPCNSSSPAWDLDSKSLVFSSDCGRALGLPALYRAPVPQE
jgi:Glycosyltransferase family 87/WD40-like Beta Propeller Repeat